MEKKGRTAHWTEHDRRVHRFLTNTIGGGVKKNPTGADLTVGGVLVEVKSCRKWCSTSHATGSRRRGRFQLHGYEQGDYILFVMVEGRDTIAEDATFHMVLLDRKEVTDRFGDKASINWSAVYTLTEVAK